MRPKDRDVAKKLEAQLSLFEKETHRLPGLRNSRYREAFIEQILESIHRVKYVEVIKKRDISPKRVDPISELFDPIKGAEYFRRVGQIEEAFWLVFLSVHFGKPLVQGWIRVADVYGGCGKGPIWTWERINADTKKFLIWLHKNQHSIRGKFGNHRKYQSLDAYKPVGTGAAISTYIKWVGSEEGHSKLFGKAISEAGGKREAFDWLYESMGQVISFGRMAKFDYLTMVGKLGLADIEPRTTYMDGATGPYAGANLLFLANASRRYTRAKLENLLTKLESNLGVGMQVIEDSICNWQKSPDKFKAFRG